MGEILLPLAGPPLVTRLILRTHQAVRTALAVGHQVQVTTAAPDRFLDVTAPGFWGFKSPLLLVGISQENAECAAMRTRTRDLARPHPIAWRLQRCGDPGTQMLQGGYAQELYRRQGLRGCRPDQTQDGQDENGIWLVGLGPSQDMVRHPLRQSRVDLPQRGQTVNQAAGFHRECAAPGVTLPCTCR